jgi:hypothetical protein
VEYVRNIKIIKIFANGTEPENLPEYSKGMRYSENENKKPPIGIDSNVRILTVLEKKFLNITSSRILKMVVKRGNIHPCVGVRERLRNRITNSAARAKIATSLLPRK